MKEHVAPSDQRLQDLLREARPAPLPPPRFNEGVWRRIERAEVLGFVAPAWPQGWLERWAGWLLRPRQALTFLALLLVAGGVTGWLAGASASRDHAQQRYLAAVAPNPLR